MKTPKVSVIIPTYNCRRYISDAIESVLRGTYQNLEIIIVDDGSTDETKRTVESFLSRDISLPLIYIYQTNQGVSEARNTGIRKATGDYFQFLNADNIISSIKLEKQVAFLEAHKEYGVIYSGFKLFNENDKENLFDPPYFCINCSGYIFDRLVREGNWIAPDTALIRRECIEKAGFFYGRMLEDWEFFLRIAYAGYQYYYMDEVSTLVRMREGSLSTDNVRIQRGRLEVLRRVYKYTALDQKTKELVKQKIGNTHVQLGFYLFKRGFRKESISNLKEGFQNYLTVNPIVFIRENFRLLLYITKNMKNKYII